MRLYGREWTRHELERYVGDMSQVGGVTHTMLTQGVEAGVHVVEFRTGTGLRFEVLPTRGMDIAAADYCGIPLAWRSATGYVHPAYYEEHTNGWLRGFHGGLLVTSGLSPRGPAGIDADVSLGLHGRVAYQPASRVVADASWQGNEYVMWTRGVTRQATALGENIQLTRQVTAWLGQSRVVVEDTMENVSFSPADFMLSYHISLGYPLIGPDSHLLTPPHRVVSRASHTEVDSIPWSRFDLPTPNYQEQVYVHNLPIDAQGMSTVAISSPQAGPNGLVLRLRYRAQELPYFVQWKMCGEGHYVLGLELTNANVMGRLAERDAECQQHLNPHEVRHTYLEFVMETLH